MDRLVEFPNRKYKTLAFTSLLMLLIALVLVVPHSRAGDPGRKARLQQETAEAAKRFVAYCSQPDVWKYDNLRPTIYRAVAPVLSKFRPPDVPVVHLSPGSRDYCVIVGKMVYLYYFYASRRKRLEEFLAHEETDSPPAGWALPKLRDEYEEDFNDEIHHAERELDQSRACYGGACAWAWPYVNLRPLCKFEGYEAATILNPFIPVPTIRLSEANSDYKKTVAALNHWEPKVRYAMSLYQDLTSDRHSAVEAAQALAAAGHKFKPPSLQNPPNDARLAKMLEIYEKIKPALRRWRKSQHKVEALAEPWYIAKDALSSMQSRVAEINSKIGSLRQKDRNRKANHARINARIQELKTQLVVLQPQIAKAAQELTSIENQIIELKGDMAERVGETEPLMKAWIQHCDVDGKLGRPAHEKSLTLLNQWIAEEPRLWQLYFARGLCYLHIAKYKEALGDIERVESKLQLYGAGPEQLAMVEAVKDKIPYKKRNTRRR